MLKHLGNQNSSNYTSNSQAEKVRTKFNKIIENLCSIEGSINGTINLNHFNYKHYNVF